MPERSDRTQPGRPRDRRTPAHEREPATEGGQAWEPATEVGQARKPTLAAERHRKSDGRLLILYHWDGEDG